jgi:hypothetical protein
VPFETIPGSSARFALISFDKDGVERRDDPGGMGDRFSGKVLQEARNDPPSHVFLFSHGWKGDLESAKDQYNRWIGAMLNLPADRSAAGASFKPLWIGLHWPSLPFGDEEFGGESFDLDEDGAGLTPDALVSAYLERLGLGEEARPQLEAIVSAHRKNAAASELPPEAAAAYRRLAEMTGRASASQDNTPDGDAEPFQPDEAFKAGNQAAGESDFGGGGFLGGVLGPLRQLSYWTMKKRARSIGESGMHEFVAALMTALPKTRVHLMGHSFGCIVMSSVVGGRNASRTLPRPVDSLALVQGAVSLWAFAGRIPHDSSKGYFNPFVVRKAVRGPIVVTISRFDKAVGTLYPLASQVSFASPSFDFEAEIDESTLPKYGAIGAFGIRGLGGLSSTTMLPETGAYSFEPGRIYNLESSQFIRKGGGVSGAHSDIDGPQVAHALWQAAAV